MNECWSENPDVRPTFSSLYNDIKSMVISSQDEKIHFDKYELEEIECSNKDTTDYKQNTNKNIKFAEKQNRIRARRKKKKQVGNKHSHEHEEIQKKQMKYEDEQEIRKHFGIDTQSNIRNSRSHIFDIDL